MKHARAFGAFWYDFVVGDDPLVAIGVVAGLALTALAAHGQLTSWWVLPAVAVLILAGSLVRAAREPSATRPASEAPVPASGTAPPASGGEVNDHGVPGAPMA